MQIPSCSALRGQWLPGHGSRVVFPALSTVSGWKRTSQSLSYVVLCSKQSLSLGSRATGDCAMWISES